MKSLVALILLASLLQLVLKTADAQGNNQRSRRPTQFMSYQQRMGGHPRIAVPPGPNRYGVQTYNPTQHGICSNCFMSNGIGYVPHPDCSRYYQCEDDDDEYQTNIRATVQKCLYGLYWNQQKLSCDYRQNVQCNTRPPRPITTTTMPTPTYTNAPLRRHVKGVCDDCILINGVGYVQHHDCTRYYQCYYDNKEQTHIVSQERKCSFGLYWNQKILSCDFPKNVQCSQNVCFDPRPKPMEDNCRGYWDCTSESPAGMCCPPRHSFNVHIGRCTPDVTCNAQCSGKDVGAIVCQKQALPNRRQFKQWTTSGWVVMPCPPFTLFNPNTCLCSEVISDFSKTPDCVPELFLPFDRSTKDQSGKKVYVENNGVKVSNGVAYFDGKGSLRINRFSNSWYGKTVVITVRYKVIDGSSHQALVCNGDCDEHPTLFIGTNSDGVEFYAKTQDSYNAVNFTIPDSAHGYQTATYVLNNMKLRGQVGHHHRHSEMTIGNLQTTSKSLTIGACGTSEHFRGYIDEVAVFLCKPPTVINYRI